MPETATAAPVGCPVVPVQTPESHGDSHNRSLASLAQLDAEWSSAREPGGGPKSDRPRNDRHRGDRHRGDRPRPSGSTGGEFFAALVIPGFTTLRRSPVLGAVLFAAGVLLPVFVVVWMLLERSNLLALVLQDRFLLTVMAAAVAGLLTRFAAITEVAVARQRYDRVGFQAFFSYVVLAALVLPVGFGVLRGQQARDLLGDIFAGSGSTAPLYVPAGGGVDGVRSVLLLGSDGGPDRFGDRTDSIILVSVHEASGRTSMVSVPRNLMRLQSPPGSPMAQRFPDGFGDLANAMYPYVHNNADITPVSSGGEFDGLSREAVVVAQAIGHSLDVRIDDYVFVDMFGFLELIDALGGVTVHLDRTEPLPPNIEGAKRPIPGQIGPGPVELDGTLAIAYARTRYADSDYGRMERQRQLLTALAGQTSPAEALVRLPNVADALDDMVRTSMSRDDFSRLVGALGGDAAITESVGLAPPLIQPGNPDYAVIRAIVAEVQSAVVTGAPSRFVQAAGN